MPSTMTHLLAAHRLWPQGSLGFFLGSIFPDAVDSDRAFKDHMHFRDLPEEDRPAALFAFARERLDPRRDQDLGVLFHLYLDQKWDAGPQARHKAAYEGESWFLDYRRELGRVDAYLFFHEPWVGPLWERLRDPDPALLENSLGLDVGDIFSFLEYHFHKDHSAFAGPCPNFTPRVLEEFCQSAIRSFYKDLRALPAFLKALAAKTGGIR